MNDKNEDLARAIVTAIRNQTPAYPHAGPVYVDTDDGLPCVLVDGYIDFIKVAVEVNETIQKSLKTPAEEV